MANHALIPFLVGMMLLTGVCNTLLTKYQDMQCVRNCDSADLSRRRNFEQPVWQTVQMFIGEMGCFLIVALSAIYNRFTSHKTAVKYQPLHRDESDADDAIREELGAEDDPINKAIEPAHPERAPLEGWRIVLLALPACCDIAGTTLMNVGLLFVAASIYQMTRGALVLFVGLFSVLFLGRRLGLYRWVALFIVVAGVAIVGLAGAIEQREATVPGDPRPDVVQSKSHILLHLLQRATQIGQESMAEPTPVGLTVLGIFLIALAQIFTASQFVIEESIMHRYSLTPLATVAWEGTFGLFFTLLFMLIMHFAYGRTPKGQGGYFDASTGWHEMTTNRTIGVSSLLIMISIGGFNFFGLSVTRTVSATSRSTIDTCRTLFIWVVSLGLGWETFKWLQVVGFAGLVYGTFLFNDIVKPPRWGFWRKSRPSEELLPERPIEHN